jgi:hypothetical protein
VNAQAAGFSILAIILIIGSFLEGFLIEQGGVAPLLYILSSWVVCSTPLRRIKASSELNSLGRVTTIKQRL